MGVRKGKQFMLERVVRHEALEIVVRTAGRREQPLGSGGRCWLVVVLMRHARHARQTLGAAVLSGQQASCDHIDAC